MLKIISYRITIKCEGFNLFKIFGRKSEDKNGRLLEIELREPVDCICDFTYNFYWQHKGEKLDPSWKVPGNDVTFGDIVDHIKNGGNLKIKGNVGHRLCSSMGTDLVYFGGTGKEISVGSVYVDGNVDTRMGISMTAGNLYISGKVKQPMGNLLQVVSDVGDYKKYRSITDILSHGLKGDKPVGFEFASNKLIVSDGTVKDTVGARLNLDAEIVVNGNVDLSTGILMRKGLVRVNGTAGKNTGALLNGGTVVIDGNTDDFTAIDMLKGQIIVNGNAGKFLAANKKEGFILAKKGSPISPVSEKSVGSYERNLLLGQGFNPNNFSKYE